jgi:hypothetical protein
MASTVRVRTHHLTSGDERAHHTLRTDIAKRPRPCRVGGLFRFSTRPLPNDQRSAAALTMTLATIGCLTWLAGFFQRWSVGRSQIQSVRIQENMPTKENQLPVNVRSMCERES